MNAKAKARKYVDNTGSPFWDERITRAYRQAQERAYLAGYRAAKREARNGR